MWRFEDASVSFKMSDISKEQVILPVELFDWIEEDKENATGGPPEKVRKVSGNTPVLQSRFGNITSEQELALCSKGFIPKAGLYRTSSSGGSGETREERERKLQTISWKGEMPRH